MTDLFAPLAFARGPVARNRLWLAPLTNGSSHDDGVLSDVEAAWLRSRSAAGFGVVETCATFLAPEGQAWRGQLGLCTDAHEAAVGPLARGLAADGALGIVQLHHGGARASQAVSGLPTWSASRWEEPGDFVPPRAATAADLDAVVAAHRDSALRAARAGFAGVELHAAHGYLLGQFLSAVQNPRTDGWGGDLVGRARLLRTCLRAVRDAVPDDFLVGVRLSPEQGGQAVGLDLDESLQTAAWMVDDGADFLHVSLWDAFRNTRKRPEEHPLPLFRQAVGDLPLVAAGKIWSRADADRVLALGADFVALGRAAICHRDWPTGARDPAFDPRQPPLSEAWLRDQGVGDAFLQYLARFGLVGG
ncbi:MAG: NADH:flavin oxidoreductase [Alphaproteobacteria bacterium]|nr:NADH:flavin oxidoreductase [Alphaproteobacteria bacterium]